MASDQYSQTVNFLGDLQGLLMDGRPSKLPITLATHDNIEEVGGGLGVGGCCLRGVGCWWLLFEGGWVLVVVV